MDLKRMRYFCTIVEQRSISKAANRLNMAQPPLSKRLQELEEEIGAPLILRNGRLMEPTDAGVFLYRRASEIIAQVDEVRRQTQSIAHQEKKRLRVGISYLFLSYFCTLIHSLNKSAPELEMSVLVSDSSHLESLLDQGRIDVALIQRPRQNDTYEIVDMTPIPLVAVIAKSLWPEAPAAALSLRELGALPLILLRRVEGVGTYERLLDEIRRQGPTPKVIMHISEPRMVLELLESGIEAAAFLPASEVDKNKLRQCYVVDIEPALILFFPSIVKRLAAPDMPELRHIL